MGTRGQFMDNSGVQVVCNDRIDLIERVTVPAKSLFLMTDSDKREDLADLNWWLWRCQRQHQNGPPSPIVAPDYVRNLEEQASPGAEEGLRGLELMRSSGDPQRRDHQILII